MEPFEVATGVVGVISLIIQITQTVVHLGLEWKDAPDNVKAFITELQALKTVLSETNTNLTVNPQFADAFRNHHSAVLSQMGASGSSPTGITALVELCNKELNGLLNELRRRSEKHERRLSWERVKSAFLAKTMRESMENRHRQCQILNGLVLIDAAAIGAATYNEVKEARAESQMWQQSEETRRIIGWLSEVDSGAQLSDHLRERQEGTGSWIFDTNQYQTWLASDQSTLFCPGVPGAGKTVAASIVIDDLYRQFQNDQSVGITFAFCTFQQRDARKEDILASLLKQLICRSASLPAAVKDLYFDSAPNRRRPSYDALSNTLKIVVSQLSKTFIILDALDEGWFPGGALNRIIPTMLELQDECPVGFLATSRFIPDIAAQFENAGSSFLEIRADDRDIVKYLERNVTELPAFVSRNQELRKEVINSIVHVVDGMFLLAHLHLGSLKGRCSAKAIRTALQDLPRGSNAYDEAYKDTMTRIEGQVPGQIELAKQVLAWIACAKRRLSKIELQHALAVEIGEPEFDEDNLPDINMMVSVCAGLVAVDESSESIRLVHYTAQEYFDRTWETWFPTAHQDIAETCVTYLSFDVFNEGICYFDGQLEARLSKFPLYDYSAKNWGHHAREQSIEKQLVMGLLESQSKVLACSQCQRLFLHEGGPEELKPNRGIHPMLRNIFLAGVRMPEHQETVNPVWGTFLVAHFGLESIMKAILDKDPGNAKLRDTTRRTPLCYAAGSGCLPIIRLLLENGADVNSCDIKGYSPLLRAVANHNEHAALLLLQNGADTKCRKSVFYSPLSFAAENGDINMTKILLENGASVRSQNELGRSPLSAAVDSGHLDIASLLLNAGANPNAEDDLHQTPLFEAVLNNHEAMVKLLLGYPTNINAPDKYGRMPLFHALITGNKAVAKLLLEKGADPNSKNRPKGQSLPLQVANEDGTEEMIMFLLENGADPSLQDSQGRTLVTLAAKKNHVEILRLLLNKGEKVETIDLKGATPLMKAAKRSSRDAVRLLLGRGADPNHKDMNRKTPLSEAAAGSSDCEEVMKMLLLKGADPTVKDQNEQIALSLAAEKGHNAIVKSLLEVGERIAVDCADKNGHTPLMKAAMRNDSIEIMEMLLDKGADPNAKDKYGESPLAHAVSVYAAGNEEIIDVLLGRGAEANSVNGRGDTVLHLLIGAPGFSGRSAAKVARKLLENGAEPDLKGNAGETPLSLAVQSENNKETIDLLLRHGADPNSRDQEGQTPFSRAAQMEDWLNDGEAVDILKLLLDKGADPISQDNSGRSPLSWAAAGSSGCYNTVEFLLDMGIDVESPDNKGRTVLSYAVVERARSCLFVYLLLRGGADPDSRDHSGRTPISWAVSKPYGISENTETAVQILLEEGCDADSRDAQGRSPLSYAVMNKFPSIEVVQMLLAEGVHPGIIDQHGRSPLSYAAAQQGGEETFNILLEQGALPDAKDNMGRGPISYAAARYGGRNIVETLLHKGADLDFPDHSGRTPLSWAASCEGNDETVKLLLEKGADPNPRDGQGRTPFYWAALCGHKSAAKILLNQGANRHLEDYGGSTPLSVAKDKSCDRIVNLILNIQDDPEVCTFGHEALDAQPATFRPSKGLKSSELYRLARVSKMSLNRLSAIIDLKVPGPGLGTEYQDMRGREMTTELSAKISEIERSDPSGL